MTSNGLNAVIAVAISIAIICVAACITWGVNNNSQRNHDDRRLELCTRSQFATPCTVIIHK